MSGPCPGRLPEAQRDSHHSACVFGNEFFAPTIKEMNVHANLQRETAASPNATHSDWIEDISDADEMRLADVLHRLLGRGKRHHRRSTAPLA